MSSHWRPHTNSRDFALVPRDHQANAHLHKKKSGSTTTTTVAGAKNPTAHTARTPHQSYYPSSGYHGQPPNATWRVSEGPAAPPVFAPSTRKRYNLCRPISSQPAVGLLYQDALFQILSFLSQTAELVSVARCCRRWYHSVRRMPSLRLVHEAQRFGTKFQDDASRLKLMARSSLRHHIGSLRRVNLGVSSFQYLHALPNLTALKAAASYQGLVGSKYARDELMFPVKLTSLELTAWSDCGAAAVQQVMQIFVDSILPLRYLTSLRLPYRTYDPLLPLLDTFDHLTFLELGSLTDRAAAAIEKLPKLRVLRTDELGHDGMADLLTRGRFLAGNHFLLGLEEITLANVCITPAVMERLVTLPSLTALHPRSMLAATFPDLTKFRRLKKLVVPEADQEGTPAGREMLADVVRQLPRLREFTLLSLRSSITKEEAKAFEQQIGLDIVRDLAVCVIR